MTAQLTPATLPDYVRQAAPQYGLDPAAVLSMAQHEGMVGGHGNPGDGNTSFGPWQLHIGGQLPSNIGALGPVAAQQWAWSTDGVDYALGRMATQARGLTQWNAVNALAEWENSNDIPGQAARAWQTYTGWLGTNIPIALDNFFNVVHPGGSKEQVNPDPNILPVPGSGSGIPIPVPVPGQVPGQTTTPGQTQTPGQTTTDPHAGGVRSQDVRLGGIGPWNIGIPSGLVLGLLGLALLLIGALLFAYGGKFNARISNVGWTGTRPSDGGSSVRTISAAQGRAYFKAGYRAGKEGMFG